MSLRIVGNHSKGLRIGLLIAGIVGLLASMLAWAQFQQERKIDQVDLNRRAFVLTQQLSEPVRLAVAKPDVEAR